MKNICLLVVVLLMFGCATPVDILPDSTLLEVRQMQTRQYDAPDKTLAVRSVVATLQDLGFTIDQADAELGTITGTRYDTDTMRMTVSVAPRSGSKFSVRANARFNESSVTDAATYQDFFVALDKTMFLAQQGID